ncbi:DUF3857 domain-containing protein [Flavihumibacter sp. CACIAM 22H1]|uniref:DUF3857 domain-containing protein n=1 Tax=Flavihumibacter sp. CACIAM 22H1 TaxID=1812911 RepID=UPI000ADF3E98|nr:DUF3857 domain-containing protein [Flavihumibacter sp. CACIAM 22H1]
MRLSYVLTLTFVYNLLALPGIAQQRIGSKELDLLKKNAKAAPLLDDTDPDFKALSSDQWLDESGVILSQKTSFDFDKKGLSVGKRISRNFFGALLAVPTLGSSIYLANARNETRMLVEETERRKILLRDKFAVEQYAVLYFRLAMESDAFEARVIKKDGTVKPVDLSEAIELGDPTATPGIFRGYTDERFSARYRPDYFKVAVPDLLEGDIIEYAFRHLNTRSFSHNPNYKEFDPVYYLCNRELPVARQALEIITQDENYFLGYKNLKGAADFSVTQAAGRKIYKWVDQSRDKRKDTRYVNEYIEMPSLKFQVIYARNSGKNFIWLPTETSSKTDISQEEFANKARQLWFAPEKIQESGEYVRGLPASVKATVDEMYRLLRKRGAYDGPEKEFIDKAYYTIRSVTMYNNWNDYGFAKVLSALLTRRGIEHQVLATTINSRTNIDKLSFNQELAWIIKYKDTYYVNPDEHLNPNDVPIYLAGNRAVQFSNKEADKAVENIDIPIADTLTNSYKTLLAVALNDRKTGFIVKKEAEVAGLVKLRNIDELLALTPYMEQDFRNYGGDGPWDGLSAVEQDKMTERFQEAKNKWKTEKPKLMKELAEELYGHSVENYKSFKVINDGRSLKKQGLRYVEEFELSETTAKAGEDLILSLPALIGLQQKIEKKERDRSLPVDIGFPARYQWKIVFAIPEGYAVKGLENLEKTVQNEAGTLVSTAKIENNQVHLTINKKYNQRHLKAAQWNQLLEVLDASQVLAESKMVLAKL